MKARWLGLSTVALMLISANQALGNEALAEQSGCFECHGTGEQAIGPPFPEIAAMHADDLTARDAMIEVVKNGGKGNWTAFSRGAPMPPYSGRLSDAEIERLVDWILSF